MVGEGGQAAMAGKPPTARTTELAETLFTPGPLSANGLEPPDADHDGNASDGDGDAVFRQDPNGTGAITRHVVHPEDHGEDEKWSVKNVEKWRATPVISEPVGGSLFRAMKILRETDPEHSPRVFAAKYPEIGMVIDISGDTPSYMRSSLEAAGIEYRKVATVSKIPPPPAKVAEFIAVASEYWERHPGKHVALHCHYGWNRSGYMIVSYLTEVLGMPVDEAIAAFAAARPPKGIKHSSFKQELRARYGGSSVDSPATAFSFTDGGSEYSPMPMPPRLNLGLDGSSAESGGDDTAVASADELDIKLSLLVIDAEVPASDASARPS
ncbi:protein-tyrosine phosphatase-like protein [Hyaloraphidium curvatum]|nr:protein-tyrosine phosphatase-like protein [Hyaloraphidium curvatum]